MKMFYHLERNLMRLVVTTLLFQYNLILVNSKRVTEEDGHSITGKAINDVLVVIAMEAEASPVIEYLSLKEDKYFFPAQVPFKAYRGKSYNDCNITVVTNGKDETHGTGVDNVGTVPATLVSFLSLQKLEGKVDVLINAGTCGGFKAKGAKVGDVFLTTAVANHDRRIPIPNFDTYGIGKIETVVAKELAKEIGAKMGVCTTGNSLDYHDVDKQLMESNDASVKDMEAAAISWSSSLFGTPHFGVKVVTDIVDGDKPSNEEFLENLEAAAKKLQEAMPIVIDHVCEKHHHEL